MVELQSALDYLWEASRYEVMGEVGKLLLPFYEEEREYEVMPNGDSPLFPERYASIHTRTNVSMCSGTSL